MVKKFYKYGETLYSEGGKADRFFFLVKGSIEVNYIFFFFIFH